MLTVEGVQFEQCGRCFNWYPAEELQWDNELLIWVCGYPNCAPAW